METLKIGRREFRVVKREGDFITVERDIRSEGKVIGKTTYDIPSNPETAVKHFIAQKYYIPVIYGLDLAARSADRPDAAVSNAIVKVYGSDVDLLDAKTYPSGKNETWAIRVVSGVLQAHADGAKVPGLPHYQYAADQFVKTGKAVLKAGVLVAVSVAK